MMVALCAATGAAASSTQDRIAFARYDSPSVPFRSQIVSMTVEGNGRRVLTGGCCHDTFPSYSPDGKRIAFTRDGRLYTMKSSGTDLEPVGQDARNIDGGLDWSPDGESIVYSRGRRFELWVTDPKGGDARRIPTAAEAFAPVWAPGGDRIAFSDFASFQTIAPDGTDMQLVADGIKRVLQVDVSPAGDLFAWSDAKRGNIFTVDGAGTRTELVGGGPRSEYSPRFSADGSTILYSAGGGSPTSRTLWTIPAGGGKPTRIPGTGNGAQDPAWAP